VNDSDTSVYEPKGKVLPLIERVRAEPQRVFTGPEAAEIMGVALGNVKNYLSTVLSKGLVFSHSNNGRSFYRGTPFDGEAPVPDHPRAPKFDEKWTPPKMIPPRAGSDVPRIVVKPQEPPPAPPAPAAPAAPPAPRPPEPAPALADASIPQGAAAEIDELPAEAELVEGVEFDACMWLDGSMTIWGAQENTDGSITIHPDQLLQLRKRMAWGHLA
jgi:hypothetical protein